MKIKTKIIIATALAVACSAWLCVNGCDYKPKWTIMTDPNGRYSYVDWDGEVKGCYNTCEEAKAARDKAWSDNYDSDRKLKRSGGYYKKVDCE